MVWSHTQGVGPNLLKIKPAVLALYKILGVLNMHCIAYISVLMARHLLEPIGAGQLEQASNEPIPLFSLHSHMW